MLLNFRSVVNFFNWLRTFAHSSPCFSLPDPVSGDRLIEAACHCSLDKKVSLNSKSIRRTLPRYMTRTSWMTWNVFVQDVECICQYLSDVLRICCFWESAKQSLHKFRRYQKWSFVCLPWSTFENYKMKLIKLLDAFVQNEKKCFPDCVRYL